jgi:peroxin-13
MASPPKPWERAGAGGTSGSEIVLKTCFKTDITDVNTALSSNPAMNNTSTTTSTDSSSSNPPSLPQRPTALNSVVNQTASNYSGYGAATRPYGSSPYGYGAGGMNSYSSPYSGIGGGIGGYGSGIGGYGTMGSMYGGGMGGMGGYGGMYGRMGGMGGMYGGGMGGMPGDPNNPSLTQSFSQSTQATFQLIESIVGAFGGFAQMLESTYMATHSSFFGMYLLRYENDKTNNTPSYGIGSRAIRNASTDARICSRDIHYHAVV